MTSNATPQISENQLLDSEMQDSVAADATLRLGAMSYEMESARYESLLSATSHLMTFVSIESVALLTALPILLDVDFLSDAHIALCYVVTFILLLAALIVLLIARHRFEYVQLKSPQYLGEYIYDNLNTFTSKADAARFYCRCIEESFGSLRKRNNKISALVTTANVLSIVSIAVIMLSGASFAIIFGYTGAFIA